MRAFSSADSPCTHAHKITHLMDCEVINSKVKLVRGQSEDLDVCNVGREKEANGSKHDHPAHAKVAPASGIGVDRR